MNSLPLVFWPHLLATVGLEVGCIAGLGFAAQHFFGSALWQRTVWRMAFAGLLLLLVSEWTGLGRSAAGVFFAPKRRMENAAVSAPAMSNFISMPATEEVVPAPPKKGQNIWWPAWIWLAGTIVVLGRMLAAHLFLWTLRGRGERISDSLLRQRLAQVAKHIGLRREIILFRMPQAISPMAFGMVRPSIGLPPGFEETLCITEQDAVLAHELAHLATGDPWWFLLADFCSALLWWHPLVWWARRWLHTTAELAADEATVLFPDGSAALAGCLVNLGRAMTASRGWGWIGVNGGFRSQLGKRVERLLQMSEKPPRRSGIVARVAVAIFLVPMVVLLFGTIQSAWGEKQNGLGTTLRMAALEEKAANPPGATLISTPTNSTIYTKVFKVDPKIFTQRIRDLGAFKKVGPLTKPGDVERQLKKYFTAAGANFAEPGKELFFNDQLGTLMVRASLADLEKIEQVVELLNQPRSQFTIESKFVELSRAECTHLGINWMPASDSTVIGILSGDQYGRAFDAMKHYANVDILSAPKVTTLSDRQTHIQSTDGTNSLTLDVLAVVNAGGLSFQMTAIATIKDGQQKWNAISTVNMWDGQTLALGKSLVGGRPLDEKMRVAFVTVTMIDRAGNRVHSAADMPFARENVPLQPPAK